MLASFIRKQFSTATQASVREALREVIDPITGMPITDAELIERIEIKDSGIVVVLAISPETHEARAGLIAACEQALKTALGTPAKIILTAHRSAPKSTHAPQQTAPRARAQWNLTPIDHVHKMIAVASGKGGVGKSTTTVQLAHALTAQGKRVGIVDADIYGPSIPRMLGIETSRQPAIENGQMVPPVAHGIAAMSMGLIMGDSAAVMRAPMITKALHQLLRGTRWGSAEHQLDILLIDMPPGTGDTHISLAQAVPLAGAIIVTTPQDVAVMDAKKCLIAFEKLGVPILGVLENMSGFTDGTGTVHRIFGEGGGRKLSEEHACAFLGEIPLNPDLCTAMDSGNASAALTKMYAEIAAKLS